MEPISTLIALTAAVGFVWRALKAPPQGQKKPKTPAPIHGDFFLAAGAQPLALSESTRAAGIPVARQACLGQIPMPTWTYNGVLNNRFQWRIP